jgi:hypothetical protein
MSVAVPRTRQETASFVISSIRSLGFNPHPSSRLMTMHRILTEQSGVIEPNDPEFRVALEADRDMQYLEFVFEQAHSRLAHPGLMNLLKPLCKDAALPQDGGDNSKGRDTQLELFAGALCQRAEFNPVDYVEPDVTCDISGTEVGLACKRAKSEAAVEHLIRKARKQIIGTGRPGVIVMETTIALNPDNQPLLMPMSDNELQSLYMLGMQRFIDRHKIRIQQMMQQSPVIGVIFHDSILRFEVGDRWSVTAMTYDLPIIADINAMQLFEAFKRGYLAALPNVEHLEFDH